MLKKKDFIRKIKFKSQFKIDKILNKLIIVKIGEFLDYFNMSIKELIYNI